MNNNRYFKLIVESLLTRTDVSKIEFLNDYLQTSNLKVTLKTATGSVSITFDYHGAALSVENSGKLRSSYLMKITLLLQEIEELLRENKL